MAEIKHDLNEKQLLFCDVYLDNGRNATRAYREAYGSTQSEAHINSSASRLLRNDKVRDYLVKVQQQNLTITQRKQDIDRDFLINQYLELVALGKEHRQLSAARQALDSLAHIAGLWIDKREINQQINIDATLQALDSGALLDALNSANSGAIEAEYQHIEDD
tara:strand:- start:1362 stop:1850 length:489 start_codon:yes stop_codon:yes gene_type:complete